MTHAIGRQFLCIHLPCFPIDRLRRHRRALRDKPLVLVETSGNRRTVVQVSPETPADVMVGMTLAEARARYAALLDFPADPAADFAGLEALGHWLMRFSPSVCVDPPLSLLLDASGLERLFGGLEVLHRRVVDSLAALRLHARVAIAPTAGAAWALAAFGSGGAFIVTPEQLSAALAPLPPEALRLDSDTIERLDALGVRTIGTLLHLSRDDLAVRFGTAMLTRIDQACGAAPEPLNYLVHRHPISATLEFDGAVDSLDAIKLAVQELIRQIAQQLTARGLGAREIGLTFRQPYGPPLVKTVRLARPCRNETSLLKLIDCSTENLDACDGFIAITLTVSASQRLDDAQATLIGGEEECDAAELDHLIERLKARIAGSVESGELIESNLPEHACHSREMLGAGVSTVAPRATNPGYMTQSAAVASFPLPVRRGRVRVGALCQNPINLAPPPQPSPGVPGAGGKSHRPLRPAPADSHVTSDPLDAAAPRRAIDRLRPLRLLRQPRAILAIVRPSESDGGLPVSFTDAGQVHRLDSVRGPERITGQWWNGRWKTRDYFDVLDAHGQRYWIFRVAQTRRWFLHGLFE